MRFRSNLHLTQMPMPMTGFTVPSCGTQGAAYPTREHVDREVGHLTDMKAMVIHACFEGKLKVLVPCEGKGPKKSVGLLVSLHDIKSI